MCVCLCDFFVLIRHDVKPSHFLLHKRVAVVLIWHSMSRLWHVCLALFILLLFLIQPSVVYTYYHRNRSSFSIAAVRRSHCAHCVRTRNFPSFIYFFRFTIFDWDSHAKYFLFFCFSSRHRFDTNKSTKGASKLRRDLINAEIANLRDLLPLPQSTRQRLSQLQLMALVCVYVRKANYFQQGKFIRASGFWCIFTRYTNTPYCIFTRLRWHRRVQQRHGDNYN